MSSTYTPSLTLTQIGNGEQSGTWGTTTNTNWQLIEDAVAGVATVSVSGTSGATLSVANGTTDQSRKAVIVVTGATSGTNAIIAPLQPKVYLVSNQTTGGFPITIGATTGSVVTIASGLTTLVYCDGTNFNSGITGFTGGNLSITGTISATGTITAPVFSGSLAGGAANQIPYQTGVNSSCFITAPANDTTRFLAFVPGTGFQWQTSSTTASSINGGTANSLVYQSSPGNTQFFPKPGTTDTYYLTYNGVSNQFIWSLGGAITSVSVTAPIANLGTSTAPNIGLSVANANYVLAGPTSGSPAIPSYRALVTADLPSGIALTGSSNTFATGTTQTFNGGVTIGSATSNGNGSITSNAYNFSTYTSIYYSSNALDFNVSTSGSNVVMQMNQTNAGMIGSNAFVPYSDGLPSLGGSGNRWSAVYAINGTIQTSDATEKTEIATLDAAELRVATRIKGLIKKFKFKDAVAKKGEAGARIHVGVIAQEVGDAFTAEGLDPHAYGVFCFDTWEAEDAKYDKDGNEIIPAKAAGSRYGVRYDELFAFIVAVL